MSYVFLGKEKAVWCPSLEETTDSLVGGYEGTHHGFTPYVTSEGKRCYFFDGTGDKLTTDLLWDSEGPVTISMWVWVDSMVPETHQLFGFDGSNSVPRFDCHINSNQEIVWTYGSLTTGRLVGDFTGHYEKWVFITLYSGGNADQKMEIMIDGNIIASKNEADYPELSEANLGYLSLGYIDISGSYNYLGGMLDDFRIFDGILLEIERDWLELGRGIQGAPEVSTMWDPCPEYLREHRAASWKITDRIGSTLAPVAKSIAGSGELTDNNTVQIQHPKDGRAFIGPAAYFDYSATESLSSTDPDLRPDDNDWTLAFICWHDNDSTINDESTQLYFSCAMRRGAAPAQALSAGVLKTGNWRTRMVLEVKGVLSSVYFDELLVGAWIEPLVIVVRQDISAGNIVARFIGLFSRTLYTTITRNATLAAEDSEEFLFGRCQKTASGSYNDSRGIQDCWTVLQDYAATEDDAFAFRDHLWQQKQFIDAFVRGQSQ